MADNEPDKSEKTEPATPFKLEESRKKGMVAKSTLIVVTAAFFGASAALWLNFGGNVYAAYLAGALMNCF